MKKHFFLFYVLLASVVTYAQTYWDGTSNKVFNGSGTETDPFLIETAEQLAGLAERTNVDKEDFAGQYIRLAADIYLTDFSNPDKEQWKEWEPIAHTEGTGTDVAYFRGHFDGTGHTVYNLYYGKGLNWADDWDPYDLDLDLDDYDWTVLNKALFGNLAGGSIENVRIANAKLSAVRQALLVMQVSEGAVVRNCHVQGEFRATNESSAGLAYSNAGLIENCSAEVVSDLQKCAGFVGDNEPTGVIRHCTSAGFIRCTMGTGAGFVNSNTGVIEQCSADVHVQALGGPDEQKNEYGGHTFRYRSGAGFVVENSGIIRECAAFGGVDGEGTSANYVWSSAIAGFAYSNRNGRIESSYCTGALRDVSDSTNVGGNPIMALFCYNNGENAIHENDDAYRGDIFNCYTMSTIRHHDATYYRNSIHPFIGTYHDFGGFNSENQGVVEPSQQIACFFANEGLPAISEKSDASWNGTGMPLAEMKTQAFADKLNDLAAFLGTSQWEWRDGLARPTGVYVHNTALLLGGGEGTKDNPYLISTKAHLENLALLCGAGMTFQNQYLKQTADVALNAPMEMWEYTMPDQWKPIAAAGSHPFYSTAVEHWFRGTYDGDFHKVENMYINALAGANYGLFSYIGKNGSIRNLSVTDAYIRANGNVGILAGYMSDGACLIQCHTSGDVTWKSANSANIGGLVGDLGQYGLVLNCSSAAQLVGGAYNGIGMAHGSSFHVWAQDTCINFLFAGSINDGAQCIDPFGGFQYVENPFIDRDRQHEINCGSDGFHVKEPTAWLQSKELVNLLNYGVSRWNVRHGADLQMNYWEWREGDYPRVAADAAWRPEVAIVFESNGGSAVPAKYVCAGSEVVPPQRPLREGYIFAGWYKDAGLEHFFDWKKERPTGSLTLYARWHEDKRWEVDITPFQNEFAKTYHIKTAAQLRGLMAMQNGLYDLPDLGAQTLAPVSFAGKTIVLDNDIVLCDTTDWQFWGRGAFGLPWKSIGSHYGLFNEGEHAFAGTFDGQGHVIFGLYQENSGMPCPDGYGGLFGIVGDGAVIKNVGVAASCLDYQNYDTRGMMDDAVHYWKGDKESVQGAPSRAGMMAGYVVDAATFDQCFTEGNIFVQSSAFYGLGGFIGQLGDDFRYNIAQVANCYSRVDVHNTSVVDTINYYPADYGFAALGRQIPVTQCYSAGHTWHSFANANNYYGDLVSDCYFNKELVQVMDYYSWGGIHYIGEPKTTNEMHAKSTFKGWDFENIWGRHNDINGGYPYLRVFHADAPEDSEDPIMVTGVTLNVTDTLLIGGQSLQLVATVQPEEAAAREVTWSSDASGSNWFTLDENGLVTTVLDLTPYEWSYYGTRKADITVTVTTAEGSFTATCRIRIEQPKIGTKIFSKRRHGETEWREYNGYPEAAENFEYMMVAYMLPNVAKVPLTWTSDDENILSIAPMSDTTCTFTPENDPWGTYRCSRALVYCKQSGSTTVHASAESGLTTARALSPQLIDVHYISIYQPPTYQGYYGLVYPQPETEIGGGETRQLAVIAGNYSGTVDVSYLPEVEWTSSNPSVLGVDQTGLIKGLRPGSATITATAAGGTLSDTTAEIIVTGTAEGVDNIPTGAGQSRKVIMNGMLYLIRPDGSLYDATGSKVR